MTREEAIKELELIAKVTMWNDRREAVEMAIEALSIDGKQGEWRHTIIGQPYCSNCEYVFGEDEEFNLFWDYCPMCGAKIKSGDKE